MRVVVIRHHGVDSAGFIGDAFEARGAALAVHLIPDDGPLPALDGVRSRGGARRGQLGQRSRHLDRRGASLAGAADSAGMPLLRICFGAQALFSALGWPVEAMDRKEIGWALVESADDELIRGRWLEFHGDRRLPPAAAAALARNDAGVQAFRPRQAPRVPVPSRG